MSVALSSAKLVALALRLIDPSKVVNVIPEEDELDHREGTDCPCRPRVKLMSPNGAMIVHTAWDGREAVE